MKPLVYFDFEEYDGDKNLVLVDKERLKEILNEVYNAGFSDGSSNKVVAGQQREVDEDYLRALAMST